MIFKKISRKKIENILLRLSSKVKRLILIIIDILILILSFKSLNWFTQNNDYVINDYLIITAIIGPIFYVLTGQYQSLSRYLQQYILYIMCLRNFFLLSIIHIILIIKNNYILSTNRFVLLWFTLTGLTLAWRYIARDFLAFISNKDNRKKVIIYGAGSAGAQLSASLSFSNSYSIICFVDDNRSLWGRSLNGRRIKSPLYLNEISKNDTDEILFAIPSISKEKRRNILNNLKNIEIPFLQIPSIDEITNGDVPIDKIRPIQIEDLLGREKVPPNPSLLGPGIKNNNICITGAGGSIGAELCKQILKLSPRVIILLDISEPNLYQINQNLNDITIENECKIIPVLGNAIHYKFVKDLFEKYKINVVFHAAAYKHVPLVENNPIAGIKNNVFTTKTLCLAAKNTAVEKLIFISTDKAVRPTNIMGASKRLSELIVQAFAAQEKSAQVKNCCFSMVRFGNVLGSSGSVVPLFKKQIETTKQITLTHPDIIRYFMTIEEAAQLVIQAEVLAKGGEVFLLDMGEPIKILYLAEQMIKLSGLKVKNKSNPNGDIEIITVGLRQGEKLYEELLIDGEAMRTKHPLIYKSNESSIEPNILWPKIEIIENFINENNLNKTLEILSELVPEWKNSKSTN